LTAPTRFNTLLEDRLETFHFVIAAAGLTCGTASIGMSHASFQQDSANGGYR
jgi:hypothetical protein